MKCWVSFCPFLAKDLKDRGMVRTASTCFGGTDFPFQSVNSLFMILFFYFHEDLSQCSIKTATMTALQDDCVVCLMAVFTVFTVLIYKCLSVFF